MSAPQLLFACSKCFARHPFEELSSGQQLCKECRGTFPVVKCTYCRSEFQQTAKGSTSTICKKCEQNVKAYGKPSACEYCNIIAAFIGNKCQRCTNSEFKYGPPVTCEQCKQKCAFEKPRDNDDKKLEGGKLLCWLCALAYKRALARTKQSDADRRAHLKMTQKRDAKHRDHNRLKSHNKRPHRVDLTKQSSNDQGNGSGNGNGNDSAPPNKVSRSGGGGGGSGLPGGRAAPIGEFDPNSSDHVVAMTQLKEKIASLQKLVSQKDSLILTKDKMITELKAKHFTVENELRNQMKVTQRDHDSKCDMLNGKIQTLLKEVATLSKSTKKDRLAAARESSTNSGSGTDSPSIP
ncbi:protein FAM76A isoform X2 [Chrysoperla carnea]|uniref:protein FAM76A isoform X2 n=1 Tax=Chrysoperla carnea TaxID=189513 RepID=UPI001D087075|nr:protein FAM76A isoform X2 [Chrysoperla carnea]